MTDSISKSLDAYEETPVNLPVIKEHSEDDDFSTKVTEFRQNVAKNATLDFRDSRKNLRTIIETGMGMLEDVTAAVQESQSDKSINAASQFMKTLGDLTQLLVKMNSDIMSKENPDKPQAQQTIIQGETNNIVVSADTGDLFEKASSKVKRTF